MSPDRASTAGEAPDPRRDRSFRERKREDHALALIGELEAALHDPGRARRLLLELGRYYDPVLGGAIMEIEHQRRILGALEEGHEEDARALIRARYEAYIKHRAHLGGGGAEADRDQPAGRGDSPR